MNSIQLLIIFMNGFESDLSVDIHPGHFRFVISLYHAEKFPSIPFVEAYVICNQIDWRNTFLPAILYSHVQKISCDSTASVFFFCEYGTNVWRQILSFMKIIFYNSKAGYDFAPIQTKVPSVFCFLINV